MKPLLRALPLLLFAGDALAWGLQTHLYFAQHAIFAVPLLDADVRRAALRFPRLVLAGACLPDLALGYASHLVSDVVAHNRFVPEHERRIADLAHVTHALAALVARRWHCSEAQARRALDWLARADRWLRAVRLPRASRLLLARLDSRMAPTFERYVRETSALLAQVGPALDGIAPAAEADPARPDTAWRPPATPRTLT